MPNKNIYVTEADLPLFEQAQEFGGGNLSSAIATALRHFVAMEQAKQTNFREVTVKVSADGFFVRKRFLGRQIANQRVFQQGKQMARLSCYSVYQTPKGKWALLFKDVPDAWFHMVDLKEWCEHDLDEENAARTGVTFTYHFTVYETLEDLQTHLPASVASQVQRTLSGEQPDIEMLDL